MHDLEQTSLALLAFFNRPGASSRAKILDSEGDFSYDNGKIDGSLIVKQRQVAMNKTGKGLSRTRLWSIIVGIGVILGIIVSCITIYEFFFQSRTPSRPGATVTTTVSQPDPTSNKSVTISPASPTGRGTTATTFTGTGSENTQSFHVGANWSMDISCDASPPLEPGQFKIDVVDNSNGAFISQPVEVEVCAGTGTSEKVPENQGGTFYLQINARADISWTIQIRVCANQTSC